MARMNSDDDFLTMQQEAIRRVRDMQQRARDALENSGMYDGETQSEASFDAEKPTPPVEKKPIPTPTQNRPLTSAQRPSAGYSASNNNRQNTGQNFGNPLAALFNMGSPNNIGSPKMGVINQNSNNNRQNPASHTQAKPSEKPLHPQSFGPNGPGERNTHGQPPPGPPPVNKAGQNQPPLGPSPLGIPGLNLNFDSDQLVIMAMLYMLFKDGGDQWLMLALAYIMLT